MQFGDARYAVFGNPVAHSLSPFIHMHFAKQTQQNLSYEKILIPLDKFSASVAEFFQTGGLGLNITVPFKLEAYALCDELTDRAQTARAVNTIKFFPDGKLLGDNTDGIGLVTDIQQNHHITLKDKNILLLGAGGAARGAIMPLLKTMPAKLFLTNRTYAKAQELASEFNLSALQLDELKNFSFDIIINATSASLHHDTLDLPSSIIHPDSFCYDMFYGSENIPFLIWAKQLGAKVADGLGMLVEQAAESFYLWRGIKPQTTPVIKLLREQVKK